MLAKKFSLPSLRFLQYFCSFYVQFSTVTQLCPSLCDPMDCSVPGFPVLHQLPKLAQTHVHRVGYHPTIIYSSCLQSFAASGSFQMSQFFTSGGQSIGVSSSAAVFPMNTQDWFPLGLTGLISLQSKESSQTSQFKNNHSLVLSFLYSPTLSTWLLEKP